MEFEFDKEINALLRHAAQAGEAASAHSESKIQNPKSPHLDADEISAFAENAVPEKTKTLFVAHFADCDRCRKILSNVVALNHETQAASSRTEEIKIAAPAAAPWYRKFFAAPGLAYAMGALVLIFAGLTAFTFLKNAPQTAKLARVSEKPVNMGGASSDGETITTETAIASPDSAASGGAPMMSNQATMTNSMSSNSAAAMPRGGFMGNAASASNGAGISNGSTVAQNQTVKNKQQEQPVPTAEQKTAAENQMSAANFAERKREADKNDASIAAQEDNEIIKTESRPAPKAAAPPVSAEQPSAASGSASAALSDAAKNSMERRADTKKSETRKTGGKNFRRAADGGVWYDANYNGQSTTNVSRGTAAYGKLDSGLRSIAETLGGTIVVVWKSKAYRIQ